MLCLQSLYYGQENFAFDSASLAESSGSSRESINVPLTHRGIPERIVTAAARRPFPRGVNRVLYAKYSARLLKMRCVRASSALYITSLRAPLFAFLCVRAHREHACTSAFPAGVTGGVYCEGGLAPLMALACPPYCRSDLPLALSLPSFVSLFLSISLSLSTAFIAEGEGDCSCTIADNEQVARTRARPRTHTSCRADYADENPSVPIMRSAFTR